MSATVLPLRARCAYCRRVYRDGPGLETTGACDRCRDHAIAAAKCRGGGGCPCAAHTFLRGVFELGDVPAINREVARRVRIWKLKQAALSTWPYWLAIAGALLGMWLAL